MQYELDPLPQVSIEIRRIRKALDLSQKQLARLAGLSQSTIARLERDIERLNPSYYTIFTVIDALNMQNMMKGNASLGGKSAEDVMHRKIVYVKPDDTLEKAVRIIKDYDFPQIPVIGNGMRILGTVSQKQLLSAATEHPSKLREILVRQVTGTTLPQVDKSTSLDKLKPILENFDAALVVENGKAVGIVTIYDILKLL